MMRNTVTPGTQCNTGALLDRLAELVGAHGLDVGDLERRARAMAELLDGEAWAEAVETLRTGTPEQWKAALDAVNGDRVARNVLLRRCLKWIERREGDEVELAADLTAALEGDE